MHHVHQGCHTHHKKLIQIGTRDAGKFQAFQKRNGLVLGLIQDAFVKFQPGKLAIFVISRVGKQFFFFFHLYNILFSLIIGRIL